MKRQVKADHIRIDGIDRKRMWSYVNIIKSCRNHGNLKIVVNSEIGTSVNVGVIVVS